MICYENMFLSLFIIGSAFANCQKERYRKMSPFTRDTNNCDNFSISSTQMMLKSAEIRKKGMKNAKKTYQK